MPGQRGLHGNVGGFPVSDFPNHDHIRVLAQNRPQATGKGHVDLGVDRRLANARHVILHRVFNGQDVARGVIEMTQRGIQAGGFARAGWPGHQKDPVGPRQHLLKAGQRVGGHAQAFEVQPTGLFIEQSHHHPFAVGRRQGRDTHIHLMTGQAQADAAILWHALFSDVQPGHDFDARDQQIGQLTFWPEHLTQLAIDAHAHRQVMFEGFEVNVGRFFTHGFAQQRVDQTDDRRVPFLLQQVGGLRHLFGRAHEVQFAVQPLRHLLGGALPRAVGAGQRGIEVGIRHPLEHQRCSDLAPHFGHYAQRGVTAHQQRGRGARRVQHDAKTPCKTERQTRTGLGHGCAGVDRLPSNICCGSRGSSNELLSLASG